MSPSLRNTIYAVVEGNENDPTHTGSFKSCGYEDIVFNHTLMHKDINSEDYNGAEFDRRKDPSVMSKRFFTV